MSADVRPDYAFELLRLRREVAALKVALADKEQANAALRLELTTVRDYCAERIEAAAEQIARIRQAKARAGRARLGPAGQGWDLRTWRGMGIVVWARHGEDIKARNTSDFLK